MGEGVVRESGMDMDTLLYFKWITSKDLLFSTGDSAQCYVAAWVGGGLGESVCVCVCVCVCVAESLAVHLKLSQRCFLIIYLPIQNEKFFKKEKTITSFF